LEVVAFRNFTYAENRGLSLDFGQLKNFLGADHLSTKSASSKFFANIVALVGKIACAPSCVD